MEESQEMGISLTEADREQSPGRSENEAGGARLATQEDRLPAPPCQLSTCTPSLVFSP